MRINRCPRSAVSKSEGELLDRTSKASLFIIAKKNDLFGERSL